MPRGGFYVAGNYAGKVRLPRMPARAAPVTLATLPGSLCQNWCASHAKAAASTQLGAMPSTWVLCIETLGQCALRRAINCGLKAPPPQT